MASSFDPDLAKKHLEARESQEREAREKERIAAFTAVVHRLKGMEFPQQIEVYLVGSITQPYLFYPHSDIDIVVKNFQGDRFDLWTQLEELLGRRVEIILFEKCHFQDHILKNGYKVI